MRTVSIPALVALLLLASGAGSAQEAGPADRPDLSGVWLLDEGESESVRDKVADSVEDPGRRQRLQERFRRTAGRERQRNLTRGLDEITIEQGPDKVTIRYGNGRERELWTDDRPSDPEPNLDFQEVQAAWEPTGLVVQIVTTHNEQVERWELSATGAKLLMTTEIWGKDREAEPAPRVSFTRVYDPRPETEPEGESEGE